MTEELSIVGFHVAPMSGFLENTTEVFSSPDWNHSTWGSAHERRKEVMEGRYWMISVLITLVVLGIIILATIIGNVFVMAAVVLEKNLQNVANYLTASLAAADLLVAILVMPLAAFQEVSSGWFLGKKVCEMWTSLDVICCTASILHLVAISLDRYWAVTRVDYIHNRSARRMLGMIAASWGLSVIISVPPLFIQQDPNYDPNQTGECVINQDPGYTIFSTVGAFYLPFLFMMIIYLKVFRAARSSIRKKRFKEYVLRETPQLDTVVPPGSSPLTRSPGDGTNMASSTTVILAVNNASTNTTTGSPDNSTADDCGGGNGESVMRNGRYLTVTSPSCVTPPSSPVFLGHVTMSQGNLRSSWLDLTKHSSMERRREASPRTKERRAREKIEQKRERKAARTLAIITGSFIVCWLPFFIIAILRPFCKDQCNFPPLLLSVILWLGYFNSLLNPVIYTIFNPDFRLAFRKILFGKYRRPKYRRAAPILTNQG